MTNVSVDFYNRIVAGFGVPEKLPEGWLVQLVFADENNVYGMTLWATLELGRDFFREKVADSVAREVASNPERVDFVRVEFRSAGLRTGKGLEQFAPEHFFDSRPSRTFVVDLHLPIDDDAGRTLGEAYRRIDALGRSPEMEDQFENGLVIATGGVTDTGGFFVFVHTDEAAGHEFFTVTLPAMLEAEFAEWPQSEHTVRSYPTHRCIVGPELIAGS